jgi:hypothetical protein
VSRIFRVLVAIAILLGVLTAGCRTLSKGVTQAVLDRERTEQWHVHYGSRLQYTLDDETMKDLEFEGSVDACDVKVRYQRGLGEQARCVADETTELLAHVQESTGVTLSTRSTIYLLRFDDTPEDFDIRLAVEPNEFPLPLFVQAGDESCESILAQNRSYPYLFAHELVETSLAAGRKDGVVLPDLSWGPWGIVHVNNYTRWFREGIANYAGYLSYKALSKDIAGARRLPYRQTLLHTNPFSSLAQVGGKLFSWRQSSPGSYDRAYYNAALGLLLLIEDRYGQKAIREIVNEIGKHKAVDGRDLVRITNRVLGVDIRRLARDFEFPEIGVQMERLTPALALNSGLKVQQGLFVQEVVKDSAAAKAAFQEKDAITAVGATPIANSLDFELAVFKVRRQPSVALTVERRDVGTLTLELPLQRPHASGNARLHPGKRARHLSASRMETTIEPVAPAR